MMAKGTKQTPPTAETHEQWDAAQRAEQRALWGDVLDAAPLTARTAGTYYLERVRRPARGGGHLQRTILPIPGYRQVIDDEEYEITYRVALGSQRLLRVVEDVHDDDRTFIRTHRRTF